MAALGRVFQPGGGCPRVKSASWFPQAMRNGLRRSIMTTTNEVTTNPQTNGVAATVDAAPTETALTPEEVVDVLRATRARIAEVAPITVKERKVLRRQASTSKPIVHASINLIRALDK